jgi:hypothetical protein
MVQHGGVFAAMAAAASQQLGEQQAGGAGLQQPGIQGGQSPSKLLEQAAAAAAAKAGLGSNATASGFSLVAKLASLGVKGAGDPKQWVVLGIESSCDDTAAAVVRGDGTILGHKVASQVGGRGVILIIKYQTYGSSDLLLQRCM